MKHQYTFAKSLLIWLSRYPSWHILIISVLTICLLTLSWVGHLGSDDVAYIEAARSWLNNFPFIPENHWSVRHTVTIPISISFLFFGDGELQSIAPFILYWLALIMVLYMFLVSNINKEVALIASILMISAPVMSENATIAGVDIIESGFALGSILLFFSSLSNNARTISYFFCGLCAGLAFMSRETAIALIVCYGIVLLIVPTARKANFVVMAAGFLFVIGLEQAYYFAVTGNPLHRIQIALGTVDFVDPTQSGLGNVSANRWLGPVLALLLNNEFGLIFWILPVAVAHSYRHKDLLSTNLMLLAQLLLTLCITWFVVVGYALDLRPVPRYFMVSVICALIIIAIWLQFIILVKSRKLYYSIISLLIGTNLLLIDLTNDDPLASERHLITALKNNPAQVIFTDAETLRRSRDLMAWENQDFLYISSDLPRDGDLFLITGKSILIGAPSHSALAPAALTAALKSSEQIAVFEADKTIIGHVLSACRLDKFVARAGLRRLIWENDPTILVRVQLPGTSEVPTKSGLAP